MDFFSCNFQLTFNFFPVVFSALVFVILSRPPYFIALSSSSVYIRISIVVFQSSALLYSRKIRKNEEEKGSCLQLLDVNKFKQRCTAFLSSDWPEIWTLESADSSRVASALSGRRFWASRLVGRMKSIQYVPIFLIKYYSMKLCN